MRRLLTQTLLAVLLLAAVASAQTGARGDDPPPPPKPLPTQAEQAEPSAQGRLEGGVYTNDYFGISFNVPRGWVVQGEAERRKIMQTGKELIQEGTTDRKKAGLDASVQRTDFLLSASKYQPGTIDTSFNALMLCLAERVPTAVIKTGADYVALMQRTLEGTAAKAEMTGPTRTERLGGVAFTVVDMKLSAGPAVTAQRYYVTIMKGHALVLAYTYLDEADLKTFDEVVRSVKFK